MQRKVDVVDEMVWFLSIYNKPVCAAGNAYDCCGGNEQCTVSHGTISKRIFRQRYRLRPHVSSVVVGNSRIRRLLRVVPRLKLHHFSSKFHEANYAWKDRIDFFGKTVKNIGQFGRRMIWKYCDAG